MFRIHFFDAIRHAGSVYAPDIDSAEAVANCLRLDAWEVVVFNPSAKTSTPMPGYEEAYTKLMAEERAPDTIPVVINAEVKMVPNGLTISYQDVIYAAGLVKTPTEYRVFSVTYSHGLRGAEGMLSPGKQVRLVPNMRFTAMDTGNA